MISDLTTHQLAAQWESEIARDLGGRRQPGSGNKIQAKLDVRAGLLIVEAKDTSSESFRVTSTLLDDILSAAQGPSGVDPSITPLLAVRMGASKTHLGVVDWDTLVSWLRSPPNLIPATAQEQLRATARTPTLLR
jgi:hypothetical protein